MNINCTYIAASYLVITIKLKAKCRFLAGYHCCLLTFLQKKNYHPVVATVAPISYVCMSAMFLLWTAENHNAQGCDDLQLHTSIQEFVKIS